MVAVATTTTGCPYNPHNFRCGNCEGSTYYTIYNVTVVTCTRCQSTSDVTYNISESVEEEHLFSIEINPEVIRLWRKLSRQRPKCRINYIVKPYFKRRLLNSKSGWLARTGYRKKRGK